MISAIRIARAYCTLLRSVSPVKVLLSCTKLADLVGGKRVKGGISPPPRRGWKVRRVAYTSTKINEKTSFLCRNYVESCTDLQSFLSFLAERWRGGIFYGPPSFGEDQILPLRGTLYLVSKIVATRSDYKIKRKRHQVSPVCLLNAPSP